MGLRWRRGRERLNWWNSLVEWTAFLATVAAVLLAGSDRQLVRIRRVSHGLRGIGLAVAIALLIMLVPAYGGLVVVAICAGVAVWWLAGRRRERRRRRTTSRAVHRFCAEMADDLAMGQVPEDAIAVAADRWPALLPVVVAAQLHHEVSPALREVAALPGAAGLLDVAAAWQVSSRSGSSLAEVLREVAHLLVARERRARLVDSELAAARATAMVVSGLPVLVLGMGAGLGANSWSFFVTGLGTLVLGLGCLLLFAGWAWLDWLAERANE